MKSKWNLIKSIFNKQISVITGRFSI